jgi:undecaprenyl-diphosphatase
MNLDQLCLAWFQAHRFPLMDLLMKGASSVASSEMCCLWAGLIAIVLMFQYRFRRGSILFFGTVLSAILVRILKLVFSRLRPPASTIYDSYSFPSGHALSSTVFFGLMAWLLTHYFPSHRKIICTVAALLALWVGLSRIILGFHWPSDVLGGFVIGFIFLRSWLWITDRSH